MNQRGRTAQPEDLPLSIITEALLEIRFSRPAKDISLVVGSLNEELSDYPVFENLEVPDFPISTPEFDRLVKYRFFSTDKCRLYSLGKGIFSVNTLKYLGFPIFLGEIEKVLTAHKKVSEIEKITRIGLLYKNKINVNRKVEKELKIQLDLPSILRRGKAGFNFRLINRFDDRVLLTSFMTEPFKRSPVILNFDCFREVEMNYDVEELLLWTKGSQEIIFKVFKNTFSKRYFNFLFTGE